MIGGDNGIKHSWLVDLLEEKSIMIGWELKKSILIGRTLKYSLIILVEFNLNTHWNSSERLETQNNRVEKVDLFYKCFIDVLSYVNILKQYIRPCYFCLWKIKGFSIKLFSVL